MRTGNFSELQNAGQLALSGNTTQFPQCFLGTDPVTGNPYAGNSTDGAYAGDIFDPTTDVYKRQPQASTATMAKGISKT